MLEETQKRLDVLQKQCDAIRAELTRIDGKAGTLIAWAGTSFAVLSAGVSLAGPAAPAARLIAAAGVLLLVAAIGVLLVGVVCPFIPSTGGTGFVAYARDPAALTTVAAMNALGLVDLYAAEGRMLSAIAMRKSQRLRAAVYLLVAALAVLAVATLTQLI